MARERRERPQGKAQASRNRPRDRVIWAILAGFLAAYVFLFILPIFLDESQRMMFFRYIPTLPQRGIIGEDAKSIQLFVLGWFNGQDPYSVEGISNGVFYPPLALLLLSPLGLVSAQAAYVLMLGLTLACYVGLSLWLPVAFSKRLTPVLLLFFLTGLFSYSLQFELERGQYNVTSVFLSLLAVFLFHAYPKIRWLRWVAYGLLTTAIQLKLYPAIFVFLLVTDWTQWRENLKRLIAIGAVNFLLLLALGWNLFLSFVRSISSFSADIHGEKINHSAASFGAYALGVLDTDRLLNTSPASAAFAAQISSVATLICAAVFAAILVACILIGAKRPARGPAPPVLLACTLGALLIPSTSFDYTIAFLPASLAIYFQHLADTWSHRSSPGVSTIRHWLRHGVVAVMSLAYFSTLFSYTNKPDLFFLVNNFPALVLLLLLTPLLAIL